MKFKKGDWVVFKKCSFSSFPVGCIVKIHCIVEPPYPRKGLDYIFKHKNGRGYMTCFGSSNFRKATKDEVIMEML